MKTNFITEYLLRLDEQESVFNVVQEYLERGKQEELLYLFQNKLIVSAGSENPWRVLRLVVKHGDTPLSLAASMSLALRPKGLSPEDLDFSSEIFVSVLRKCLDHEEYFRPSFRFTLYERTENHRRLRVAYQFKRQKLDPDLFKPLLQNDSATSFLLSEGVTITSEELRCILQSSNKNISKVKQRL